MFGKRVSQYLAFQWPLLALTAAFGLARLGLSLAGTPDATVRWLSMNVLLWAGAFYYGVAVHRRGFGSCVRECGSGWFQHVAKQGVAAAEVVERVGLKEGVEATQRKRGYVHHEDKEENEKEDASGEHHETAGVSCGAQGEPARDTNESEGDGAVAELGPLCVR